MDQYRIVAIDGREYGPTDLQGLLQWIREGRVLKATLVRKGDAAPVPAETLPELALAFAGPPPPVAVPPFSTIVTLPSEFRSWEFIGIAWEIVKPHWLPLCAMFLIVNIISAVPYVGPCAFFVIGGAVYVGINRAILGMLAGRPPTVGMMFEGFDRFGEAFLSTLIVGLLVGLGTLFCIVPGVILLLMWMFVNLIIAETPLDFWEAMKASADLTAGYRWPLFGLFLANLLVVIAGFLACCVGIFLAEPIAFTSLALAYRFLQARQTPRVA
jgi:uncharacterized membrane protein